MKKTALLAVALATCLGYAPARAADVVSSNIVGYQKVNVVKGLNLLAGAFVDIGDTMGCENINNAIVSDNLGDSSIASFWNPTTKTYSTITYYETVYADDSYEKPLGAGWGDGDAIIVDEDLHSGEGFWLQATTAATVTLNGEVNTNAVTVSLVAGMNLIGNPFPADIPISHVTSDNLGDSSVMSFWNATTKQYSTITYYQTVYADDTYETPLGAGWGDADAIVVNDADYSLGAGEGVWIQATSAADVKITF